MVRCENCGKENDKDAVFCESCGANIETKSFKTTIPGRPPRKETAKWANQLKY